MVPQSPPYLLNIKTTNYRSLVAVDLSLGPLNVLVGPNGAGKSSLLDVIAFLGDSARRDLAPAITRRGGFHRVCFRGAVRGQGRPWVAIEIDAAVTANASAGANDSYSLRFRPAVARKGARVEAAAFEREETFTFKRVAGRGRRITLKGSALANESGDAKESGSLAQGSLGLATLPKLGREQGGDQVRVLAELFESFRVFDVDVAAARRPSASSERSQRLADDASNLAGHLQHLASHHPQLFSELVDDARLFVPGLLDVVFRTAGGAGDATVTQLVERGLADATDLADASFGTIRALALLALLYEPDPPRLTCIEEIDHGLHPYVLDRLVELLRAASRKTQVLVATHSPALVNRLNASELIVCERADDGSSRIPAIDAADVALMEQELDGELALGELWFTGALGGVPTP